VRFLLGCKWDFRWFFLRDCKWKYSCSGNQSEKIILRCQVKYSWIFCGGFFCEIASEIFLDFLRWVFLWDCKWDFCWEIFAVRIAGKITLGLQMRFCCEIFVVRIAAEIYWNYLNCQKKICQHNSAWPSRD